MIPKGIDDITKSDIEALITEERQEGREIEYKKELPRSDNDSKREFLADVSSFANATGGDLIFGMEAEAGLPKIAAGVSVDDSDDLILRLENSVRSNLAPRLLGLRTKVIPGFPGGSIVIMRIARSWAAPHMITFKERSHFFIRNSAGKHPMDVTEIRSAFLLSEGVADRVRRFRESRLATVLSGELPVVLKSHSLIVLHLIPIADYALSMPLPDKTSVKFHPVYDFTADFRYNIDGLLVTGDTRTPTLSYCQIFRSGAVETVNCLLLSQAMPLTLVEEKIEKAMQSYLPALDSLGVPFPLVFACSFLGIKGKGLPPENRHATPLRANVYDRNQVHFPDVLIESSKVALPEVLKPVFDAMWQGLGIHKSPNYHSDGKWVPN